MKKVELLSPAGNFDMLKAAIMNGADAVYLAGSNFGARKFAKNFTNEEIIEAIKYAHLYNVKIYVTVNTLVKENEVTTFINFIDFLHKNSVDAVIMQDIGMINLVRKMYPNLIIHASTQFNNHNNDGLEYLKSIGVKRAVLAREMSIDEIKKLTSDIEKEIFVHGALCISYSGLCLMSSIVMGRSGNRGECAGMCRLPYNIIKNTTAISNTDVYPLSTKELCTIDKLKYILDLNISSIKIEGRMKSIEYVAYVTKLYRLLIDKYYKNEPMLITENEYDNLKVIFNRGFTHGKLFNSINDEFMNTKNPNHIGIEIGKVLEINNKKITIKLSKKLNQGDAIKFKESDLGMYVNFLYDQNDNLINFGKIGDVVLLDNKINLKDKDTILKTIDKNLMDNIMAYKDKKVPINITVKALLNEPLEIFFKEGDISIKRTGNIIEKSNNKETTKEEIKEKLFKLGNTPFIAQNITFEIDNSIFIPLSEINSIRRELTDKLIEIKTSIINKSYKKINPIFTKDKIEFSDQKSILIDKEKDYINNKSNVFYTSDKSIYTKYKQNGNIYYNLPRIVTNLNDYNNEFLVLSDIGSINKYKKDNRIISSIYLNITNSYSVKVLHQLGVEKVGISPELSLEDTNELYKSYYNVFGYYPNIESLVYGKIELMIMKHCLLNQFNKNKICIICKDDNKYYLKDRNNELYRIITKNCLNILLNYKIRNRTNLIEKMLNKNILISLIDIEDKKEIMELIRK